MSGKSKQVLGFSFQGEFELTLDEDGSLYVKHVLDEKTVQELTISAKKMTRLVKYMEMYNKSLDDF